MEIIWLINGLKPLARKIVYFRKNNSEYYRLRQQVTKHQFGTLKRQRGFTFTLMKGKQNVLSEVNLIMMVYNLRRLISICTSKDLKNKLKALNPHILNLHKLFLAFTTRYLFKSNFLVVNPLIIKLP